MIVKRVGVLSLGKVLAVVYGGLGLIVGALFAVAASFGSAIGSALTGSSEEWFASLFLGAGAVIFLPVIYGFFGLVSGIVIAAIYNLAVRWVGGLELTLE